MRWAPIYLAVAAALMGEGVQAAPFARCSSESFTTGGLARGEGEGVWVPSDFRVAFDCAALVEGPPDPAPVYALFNTLFGFESSVPLPPGRFEIETERSRPIYRFVPERPDAFGQWWREQVQVSAQPQADYPVAPVGRSLSGPDGMDDR